MVGWLVGLGLLVPGPHPAASAKASSELVLVGVSVQVGLGVRPVLLAGGGGLRLALEALANNNVLAAALALLHDIDGHGVLHAALHGDAALNRRAERP